MSACIAITNENAIDHKTAMGLCETVVVDSWGFAANDPRYAVGCDAINEDVASGSLDYAKARFIDPDTARFNRYDPWEGDQLIAPSLHKYLYAYQNPTAYYDPTGNSSELLNKAKSAGRAYARKVINDLVDSTVNYVSEKVASLLPQEDDTALETGLKAPLIVGDALVVDPMKELATGGEELRKGNPVPAATAVGEAVIFSKGRLVTKFIPDSIKNKFSSKTAEESIDSPDSKTADATFEHTTPDGKTHTFSDTNQKRRSAENSNPDVKTPMYDKKIQFEKRRALEGKPKVVPNKNMADSHAEVGSMQQSLEKGNKGGVGTLIVDGQNIDGICGHCKKDIKPMADALELDKFNVVDKIKETTTTYIRDGKGKLIKQ